MNLKLLDGMHEGVLILSKANRSVLFCNKPSEKFLEAALAATDNNGAADKDKNSSG